MKINTVQRLSGWFGCAVSATIGIAALLFGTPVAGIGCLLIAVALFPRSKLPIAVRLAAAIVGTIFS